MSSKKIKKRFFTMADQVRLQQANSGLRLAIDMQHTLRKDRSWMADEIRRLRGILDEHGIEYEKRTLRTPEEIEEGNERFTT